MGIEWLYTLLFCVSPVFILLLLADDPDDDDNGPGMMVPVAT
jgi:hypothetical protein|tara:strand:- start:556 stop:681 length:126 start_codon:yes stop_codon:yes gene_type:complete